MVLKKSVCAKLVEATFGPDIVAVAALVRTVVYVVCRAQTIVVGVVDTVVVELGRAEAVDICGYC